MANIPTNPSAQILLAGQSLTGSFGGFIVCSTTGSTVPTANFTGLKDSTGGSLLSGSMLCLTPGVSLPVQITSASLDPNSLPVIFYR